jgi:hypothetical protein
MGASQIMPERARFFNLDPRVSNELPAFWKVFARARHFKVVHINTQE